MPAATNASLISEKVRESKAVDRSRLKARPPISSGIWSPRSLDRCEVEVLSINGPQHAI